MRTFLLINPNTSDAMTAVARQAAASQAPADVELVAVTASFGFPVITTRLSYAVGAYAALDAYAAAGGPYDAVILACFGDPGLEALRELAPVPVVGFAEASIRAAHRRREPFAIVTVGASWVSMLEERVVLARASDGFIGVFALDGNGLDALGGADQFFYDLEGLVRRAVAAGAHTIILGGASLAGLADRLPPHAHYIDCARSALAEASERSGASHRRPIPQPRPWTGLTPQLRHRLTSSAED